MKRIVPRVQGPAKEVARGELIGLEVRVAASPDAGIVGLRGRVIDETLHTLTVRRLDGREVQLAKAAATWAFVVEGREVEVPGRAVQFRPWDRAKKVR